ncbi:hypothetical protein LZG00_17635 [Rhodobacteraceae bacterium LMO-12]|nr:hypothetical protein [Rhodobacteraceae bacterium LMO-JJ12]
MKIAKAKPLITRRLRPIVEQRAAHDYDVVLNDDDRVVSSDELIAACREVDAVLPCHSEHFSAEVVDAIGPRLKIIANHSVGTDHVDLAAAKVAGVVVTNTPDVLSDATAEIAILCMLGAARRGAEGDAMVRSGQWTFWSPDFMVGRQVTSKRFGVLGIRPAAFCGIVGLKPTFDLIPRTGILPQSPFLDTVGVFGRSVEDCALLAEILAGHDPADRASELVAMPRLLDVAQSKAPVSPVFAFAKLPGWEQADPQMIAATEDLVALLGEQCFEVSWPDLDEVAAIRERINFAEMAKCYYGLERRGRDLMPDKLKTAIDQGKSVLARDYIAALDWRELINAGMDAVFARCDAILCPAALGPAPEGLDDTGSSVFNGIWTLSGMPAVTLPVFTAENGMPMGVQLVGRLGDDARLLRTARWLATHLETLDDGN